jgi:hypothetical protein
MRRSMLALLFAGVAAALPQSPDDARKLAGMTVVFSVDLPLDVPGAVLQPGTYVLRVKREAGSTGGLAHLQLFDATETNVIADLSAVQSYDPGSSENSIISYYEGTSGRRILKSWNLLTTHYSERIVYSPEQATDLAKITSETVLAMPLAGAPVLAAGVAPPTAPPTVAVAPKQERPPAPVTIASAAPVTPPARFPKTAGNLPLILWLGFTCLAAFIVLRLYRTDPALAQNARNNAVARRAAASAYRTSKAAHAAAGKQA